jgi:uridine phosphorylase
MSFPNLENKHLSDAFFSPNEYIEYIRKDGKLLDFVAPKGVIFIYNSALLQYIIDNEETIEIQGFFGKFYLLKKHGIGVSGKAGIGPSGVSTVLEQLVALGTKKFISIGTAGGLQKDLSIGDFVVCNKSIRDEGVSHHYLAPGKYAYPSELLTKQFKKDLESKNVIFKEGPSWTIETPYRETVAELKQYQEEGVLTVEMESSAMMAVAEYRKVDMACAFVVSDSLADLVWNPQLHSTHVKDLLKTLYHSAVDTLKSC